MTTASDQLTDSPVFLATHSAAPRKSTASRIPANASSSTYSA
jgi:hypothetical protein